MFRPFYKSSAAELRFFKKYLDKNLKKGFIKKSQFPAALLILFMLKFNGKKERIFCTCVNYRKLNDIIIKNRYLLLNIQELKDRLNGVK